jgi:dienelactone hydrolase
MKTPNDPCPCDDAPRNPAAFSGIKVRDMDKPTWVLWGAMQDKAAKPATTLFQFGGGYMDMLAREDFNKIGFILADHGYHTVATDSPCYGFDLKPGEAEGLPGWRGRIERNEKFLENFAARNSQMLDHLIKEGYTDPDKVIAVGSCRGGFLALHWAALEPRVKCVVAFTPSTDLRVVSEFAGMENDPRLAAVAIHNQVDRLSDRAVWSCLGNADDRVGTDSCLAFMRKLMDAAVTRKGNKPADVEFHLSALVGHTTCMLAHEEAAMWVRAQMAKIK